jgi:hypothetical protein
VFKIARHWSLSSATRSQRTLSHLSLRSMLILSYHMHIDLRSCVLPSALLTKMLYTFAISSLLSTYLFHHCNTIWWRVQITKLFIMTLVFRLHRQQSSPPPKKNSMSDFTGTHVAADKAHLTISMKWTRQYPSFRPSVHQLTVQREDPLQGPTHRKAS